jgi:hypothetical protein
LFVHADPLARTYGDIFAHGYRVCRSDAHGYGHTIAGRYADASTDGYTDADTCAYGADIHGDTFACGSDGDGSTDSNTYTLGSDPHGYANADGYTCAFAHVHAPSAPNSDPDCCRGAGRR